MAPRIRSTLVPRTTLVDRLVRNDAQTLTMVVGPAGAGKSSVLAEWSRRSDDGSVAWLSADRNDADPTRFWRAFIAAVQTVEPTFGVDAADAMTLDGAITPDALESLLVDDQIELSRRTRLVIDDFQFVSLDAVLQLRQLLERGLSNLRLLVGSRGEPGLGVQRLRLRNDVCEITETDLRLDLDQTRDLVAKIGLDPATIDLGLLHSRTEGWAAGIHLAALSASRSVDPAASIRALSGNHHAIASYLAAEVLANQPDRIRRFLEDTCVVDELDEEMCEALTSDDDGPVGVDVPTLSEVEAANLFLTRVDESGTVFRYHQLFCHLLRDQLRSREPARFRMQHRRAADAHMRSSNIPAAVDHYWAAGERDLAAHAINGNILAVLHSRGAPPVDPHVDIGEHDPSDSAAEVAGYAAALLMNGRPAEARSLLEQIDLSAPTISPTERMHLQCLVVPTQLMLGDSSKAAEAADQILELLLNGAQIDEWTSMMTPIGIKSYAWEENFDGVEKLVKMFEPSFNPEIEHADVAAAVAVARYEEGLLSEAVHEAEAVHAYLTAAGLGDHGIDLVARTVLGCALVEIGEFDAAAEHLSAVLATPRPERVPMFLLASLGRARLMRANGQFDAALRAITTARRRLPTPSPTTLSSRLDELEITINLDLGDTSRVAQLTTTLRPGWRADAMSAWIEIAAGRLDAAATIVQRITPTASSPRQRLNVALMSAHIACDRQSSDMEAAGLQVLALAEETGAVLRIAEAGSDVLQLVCGLARQQRRTAFITRLLAARPLQRPATQVVSVSKADELSAREVIVLQYLATSMSYQEIAAALYLSINTVKTHVKNVLRKLSASSRAEAVRRATELHYF